jgi:hypothetical protein
MNLFINTFIYKFPQNDLFDKLENYSMGTIPLFGCTRYPNEEGTESLTSANPPSYQSSCTRYPNEEGTERRIISSISGICILLQISQ